MNTPTRPRKTAAAFTALLAGFLTGCALFVSSYDATTMEKLTSIKAYHLKFIEDFTQTEGKAFDFPALERTADAGELRFREAREYAQSRRDGTRVRALALLHERFTAQCDRLKKTATLFSRTFSEDLTRILTRNYDEAIRGEAVRPGAPQH